MLTIRMSNIHRLSPQAARALFAIARCYGAQFGQTLYGAIHIVLPGTLVPAFLVTVQRDILPMEIEIYK